jgi:hypothetical protein
MENSEVYEKQVNRIKYESDFSKSENRTNQKNSDEITVWKQEMTIKVKTLHI